MNQKGNTLIEVLITIAIIAIVATTSGLLLFGTKTGVNLESDRKTIVAFLRDARSRSLAHQDGVRWGVRFIKTGTTCNVTGTDEFVIIKETVGTGQTHTSGKYATCVDAPTDFIFGERKSLRKGIEYRSLGGEVVDIVFEGIAGEPVPGPGMPFTNTCECRFIRVQIQGSNPVETKNSKIHANGVIE